MSRCARCGNICEEFRVMTKPSVNASHFQGDKKSDDDRNVDIKIKSLFILILWQRWICWIHIFLCYVMVLCVMMTDIVCLYIMHFEQSKSSFFVVVLYVKDFSANVVWKLTVRFKRIVYLVSLPFNTLTYQKLLTTITSRLRGATNWPKLCETKKKLSPSL